MSELLILICIRTSFCGVIFLFYTDLSMANFQIIVLFNHAYTPNMFYAQQCTNKLAPNISIYIVLIFFNFTSFNLKIKNSGVLLDEVET